MTNHQILVHAFTALTPEQQANLLWHVEHDTPICCGEDAELYLDGAGGG